MTPRQFKDESYGALGEEIALQKKEKGKLIEELIIAKKKVDFQNKEKGKRAAELIIANEELAYQNKEKQKRASELIIANRELNFQKGEKEKRAAELIIADKELAFQNEEKDNRAKELIVANKELAFQNKEKGKRAKELIIADKQLIVASKELEKTEVELKVTHERLLFHVHNTPLGYIEWDREGHPKYKSQKAEEIFGWTMKELLAGEKTAYDQVHAEDLDLVYKSVKQLINGEVERNRVQNRNITKDGKTIWCEWFNSVLKDKEGNVITIMSLVQDITEQKKTEENLAQSENRFRALIERSTDMKTLSTIDGEFIYVSPSVTKLFGYSLNEILNTFVFDIIHPDDIPEFAEQRQKILQAPGNSFHTRLRILHKNGTWIPCEGSVTNMLDEPGINALVANFRDISEKISNDINREFESNNLDALINNTGDLMWSVDRDFNLITSNLPFDEMGKVNFGKTIPKGGNVLATANSPEMRRHFKELYERAFAGEAFTEISYFGHPVEFWTEVSYYPIRNGKEIIGTACHSRDVTELKRGEQNLKQSEARLKEAQALSHISNWEVDLLTGISKWSDEVYHILGIRQEDVQPSPEVFLSYIHPHDFKDAKEKVEKTLETFEGSSFYARINPKNGTSKYVYTEWKFEFDKSNKPIRLYGILQDVTERKLAEETIMESEARFRGFFDNSPEVIVVLDLESLKFTKTNLNASKLFKFSSEEFVGKGPADISPEFQPDGRKSAEKAMEYIKQAIGGERVVFEWVNCDADKKEIMCEVHLTILPDTSRPQIYASIINITERKRAEEKDKFQAALLNTIGQAVVATDLSGIINFWNNAAEKIYGWTAEETLGKNVIDITPAEQTKEQAIEIMDQLAQGNSWSGEFFVQHKNGHSFPVFVTDAPTYDQFHKLSGIIGVSADVSERKKIEADLEKTNERLLIAQDLTQDALNEKNIILESIGDGFFAVDKNWTVTYWNSKAEKLLETPKDVMLGHNLWEIFSNSTDSESYKKYHQAIETKSVINFEDYYPTLNKWYEISAYPSDNGLAVYFKDITDRKFSEINLTELNANLRIQTDELVRSNAELEQFAYVASHDLQEPLRTVTSFLTLLENKYENIIDDKGKKYIDFAVDGSNRMRKIIQDLLEFSKAGRTEDNLEGINLNELISEIQISFQKQINEKGAVIDVGELPVINSYKTPIRQAFQNLISNALKYSRKNIPVKILISATALKDHWQFCVADNGIGIDSEYFDKIFIIFQRLHNKDEFSGTGIGLPVTKKIIENLGGKIWVESEEGKGSAFYFTLPRDKIMRPGI